MLTVQNPKKSWLAMKPAFSLVEDAVSGAAIQARVLEWGAIAFSVAAAAAVSGAAIAPFRLWLLLSCLSPAEDGLVLSQLALLSPLFCECAWRCLRLGLFSDSYPTVWVAISS